MGMRHVSPLLVLALVLVACGDSDTDDDASAVTVAAEATTSSAVAEAAPTVDDADGDTDEAPSSTADDSGTSGSATYEVEVWADNWMAVYVDGVLIGEDSVSITTERSFNAETFAFDATAPFVLGIEAKDFKETDSGIEYIGANNQQMGDGGLIAQVTNLSTGEVVAVTDASWRSLVVHRAPLNKDCERDADPDATCEFEIIETPADWAAVGFDDSDWVTATEWSAGEVGPKDGYDEIDWDGSAALIWGTDLEIDNTILFRTSVG